jgi:chromosome segregation ATPase
MDIQKIEEQIIIQLNELQDNVKKIRKYEDRLRIVSHKIEHEINQLSIDTIRQEISHITRDNEEKITETIQLVKKLNSDNIESLEARLQDIKKEITSLDDEIKRLKETQERKLNYIFSSIVFFCIIICFLFWATRIAS